MNISPLTIYLWQQIDTWSHVAMGALFVTGMLSFILIGIWKSENEERAKIPGISAFVVFVISLLGVALIPSSKTVAMMIVIPEIAHSKVVQQDLPELWESAMNALKNELKTPAVR